MTRPLTPLHLRTCVGLAPDAGTDRAQSPDADLDLVSHGDPDDELVPHLTHDPDTGLPWPEPSVPEPEFVALALFLYDAVAISTDGCLVEPDGVCQHGHPSWLRRLGVI